MPGGFCHFGTSSKFQKQHKTSCWFRFELYQNKSDSFVRLSEVMKGLIKCMIIFPAGKEGEERRGIAKVVKQVLFKQHSLKLQYPSRFYTQAS